MWIFTTIGFFSSVRVKPELRRELGLDPEFGPWVMVRGRVREDLKNLVALADRLPEEPLDAPSEKTRALAYWDRTIFEWEGRDYPYRVIMPQAAWVALCEALATEVDYPNFKGRVTQTQGQARHDLYGRVWGVMHNAEKVLRFEGARHKARQRSFEQFDRGGFEPDYDRDFDSYLRDRVNSIFDNARSGKKRKKKKKR